MLIICVIENTILWSW